MKIIYASNELISAASDKFESNYAVSGQRLVQLVPYIRASAKKIIARGNAVQIIRLKTQLLFTSHVDAQIAQHCAFPLYPETGPVTITCGEGSETPQDCFSPLAALTGYDVIDRIGLRLLLDIELTCQPFSTTIPPGFVNPNTVRNFERIAVSAAAETLVWVYPVPYGSGVVPVIGCTLARPSSSDPAISIDPIDGLVTNTQTTFKLGAPTPSADYKANLTAEH